MIRQGYIIYVFGGVEKRKRVMVKFLIAIIFYTVTVFDITLVTVSQCHRCRCCWSSAFTSFGWIVIYLGDKTASPIWFELFYSTGSWLQLKDYKILYCRTKLTDLLCYILFYLFVAKNLDIHQVLNKNSHTRKEEFVPVLKRNVKSQVHYLQIA